MSFLLNYKAKINELRQLTPLFINGFGGISPRYQRGHREKSTILLSLPPQLQTKLQLINPGYEGSEALKTVAFDLAVSPIN